MSMVHEIDWSDVADELPGRTMDAKVNGITAPDGGALCKKFFPHLSEHLAQVACIRAACDCADALRVAVLDPTWLDEDYEPRDSAAHMTASQLADAFDPDLRPDDPHFPPPLCARELILEPCDPEDCGCRTVASALGASAAKLASVRWLDVDLDAINQETDDSFGDPDSVARNLDQLPLMPSLFALTVRGVSHWMLHHLDHPNVTHLALVPADIGNHDLFDDAPLSGTAALAQSPGMKVFCLADSDLFTDPAMMKIRKHLPDVTFTDNLDSWIDAVTQILDEED